VTQASLAALKGVGIGLGFTVGTLDRAMTTGGGAEGNALPLLVFLLTRGESGFFGTVARAEMAAPEAGLFSTGEAAAGTGLPMTMDTVLAHAEAGGVGLEGISVRVVSEAPPGFFGWAAPSGTEIHLYPSAFADSESLITTLGHERMHAYQFQTFGAAVNANTTNARLFENAALQTQDSFYQYHLWRGGGH